MVRRPTERADDLLVDIIGGGTLPQRIGRMNGRLNASPPFVRLTANDDEITVAIRSTAVSTFFAFGLNLRDGEKRISWTARWGQLDRVLRTRSTIVLQPVHGRACLFSVWRPSKLEPLIRQLDARAVPIERVRSLASYSFRL